MVIARESIFGKVLMATSSVGGRMQGISPLPTEGLEIIRQVIFSICPAYHKNESVFESTTDATVSPAIEGVISENEAHAADSAVLHEEPGPSRPPVDTTEGDVSPLEVMEAFVEGWVQALDHEDRKSLAMLLCFVCFSERTIFHRDKCCCTNSKSDLQERENSSSLAH